jgi:hypothetical protein
MKTTFYLLGHLAINISSYPTNDTSRLDNPMPAGHLREVQDYLTGAPDLHEQAFKAEGISKETKPQQMAMDT